MSELSQELVERGREGAEARGAGETRVGVASTLPAGSSDVATAPTVALPQGAQPAGPLTPVSTQPASGRWSTARLPVVERGAYAPLGEVAQGGIGRVLSAHDERLCRTVAIKELLEAGGAAEERFVREALLTARLQHPSIVPVYEAGRWPTGEPFYAMKLVSGRPLSEVIAEHRSLDGRLPLLPHVLSVAEAVAYAHEKRVIHRDLKPANVLLGAYGETVVIDWGLGKDLAEEPIPEACSGLARKDEGAGGQDEGLTMQGAVMGTPAYMPPEQAAGEAVDERADVYALGAILYHLLSGAAPYEGGTSMSILKQVLIGPPTPLRARQRGIPEDLLAIVDKAMARERAARYRTAKELAEDLRRFLAGQLVEAHRYTPREKAIRFARRHRAALLVGAVALLQLVGLGAWSLSRVVRERNIATQRQQEAEIARQQAEEAERRAEGRADELILVQARAALTRDPNEALSLLKTLSPTFDAWEEARIVAADAASRGIAKVLLGHTASINAIAFSPDGARLASASDDRTVRLWDLATGESRALTGHTDEAWFPTFSPDGAQLVTTSKDHTIRVWDTATGAPRVILKGHQRPSFIATFWPDARTIWSQSDDKTVRLWDLGTGKGRVLASGSSQVHKALPSPDGRHFLGAGADGSMWLFDVAGGAPKPLVDMRVDSDLTRVAPMYPMLFAPGGKAVIAGGVDGGVRIWDAKTEHVRALAPFSKAVVRVAVSRDGTKLAAAAEDGAVRLYALPRGTWRALPAHESMVTALSFSPDGRYLASGGFDRAVHLDDLDTGEHRTLPGGRDIVAQVLFSPDSARLAVAGVDGAVRLFRLDAGPGRLLGRAPGPVLAVALAPAGDVLAEAGADGVIRLHDVRGKAPPVLLEGHIGKVLRVTFSPSGELIASLGADGTARLWDRTGHEVRVLEGVEVAELPFTHQHEALAFSPDGRFLATGGAGGAVLVWDVDSGERRELVGHKGRLMSLAFSPDGAHLVTGAAQDPTVRLWDLGTGEARVFAGHEDGILAVAFSPDGARLASGSLDHTLRLWDIATGKDLRVDAGGYGVEKILFTPEGNSLVTLGGDSGVRVWNPADGTLRRALRGHAGTVLSLSLSADGSALVTGSMDRTARLWDLESGEHRILRGHEGVVNAVGFSPGGDYVISAGTDGTVRLWQDDLPREPGALRAWIDAAVPVAGGVSR